MDMKSISQKLQDDIRAVMEANLHPNQQKIDVHEPEKDEITAHDFKKLRAMKKDQHGKITKEDTDDQIQELAGKAAQQAAIAISLIKAGKKDGKMPKPMKEDSEQVEEEEKKKIVSPFDYKNYQSQIPKKPGETAGFDSKKISTGTVYSRKPVKEESHQSKTTMKHIPNPSPALKKAAKDIKPGVAGYRDRIAMLKAGGVKEEAEIEEAYQTAKSEFVARQGRLTAAAAETEKDPARLKRMSNIPGYSAAMDLAKKTTQGAKHTKEEVEQMDELSVNTLNRVHRAAVKSANDASRDGDEARADKRYNLAGKASNKAELKNRAAGLKPSGQHALESVEQEEYTFADYLEAARAQYVDEDAVLVANEAFKNKDITLFSDQSQSPEA